MLAKFSVKKPLTVMLAVLVVIVLGVVSYTNMTPDLLPNMDFPYAVIVTTYPGASAEKVEGEVTKPIEQSMATLENFSKVQSTSSDNYSMVVLQFTEDANMDAVSIDIRESLDLLEGSWGDMVGTPYVLKLNPNIMPVAVAAVNMEGKDVAELSAFLNDTLLQKLEGVDGVASVQASGTIEETANVFLSEAKIAAVNEKLRASISRSFADGERQIADARGQLTASKQELAAKQNEMESQLASLQSMKEQLTALQQTAAELAATRATLYETVERLRAALQQANELQAALSVLPAGSTEYQAAAAGLSQIEAALADSGVTLAALPEKLAEAEAGLSQVESGLSQINDQLSAAGLSLEDVPAKIAEIDSGIEAINAAFPTLSDGAAQVDSALAELDAKAAELAQKKQEMTDGVDISDKINMSTISGILTAQNFSMPAGYVTAEDGVEYLVRVGEQFSSAEEMENLTLFDLGMDGVDPVRLSDVADVAITDNAAEIYAKINGADGVILTFTKQSTAATAAVTDSLSARFDKLEEEYAGLSFTMLMSQGDYIHMIVNSVIGNFLWGAVLAVLILLLFLRDLKPTFMIAMSIPVSVVFAIVLMYFSGVTLNMISLSGLAIGVGMLVDNSVVVIENIYRLRGQDATAKQAAVVGAKQVAAAITSSTLTTICVFLPIVFVEGITRQLFTDMALTIAYSLLASLIVALTFVPAAASGMLKKQRVVSHKWFDKFISGYEKVLRAALNRRVLVLALAVLLLVGSVFFTLRKGFSFMPEMSASEITVTLQMPEDAAFEETTAMSDQVIERIEEIEGVETVGAMIGGSNSLMGLGEADTTSVSMYVLLQEAYQNDSMEIAKEITDRTADLDCEIEASGASDMSSMMSGLGGSGVSLNIYNDDLDTLRLSAQEVGEILSSVEGIEEVDNGLDDTTAELSVTVDKTKAALNGLTVAQVYQSISAAMTTETTSTTLNVENGSYTVLVHSTKEGSVSDRTIRDLILTVTGTDGAEKQIPLTDLAEITESQALNSISRTDQRRYIQVSGSVCDGYNVSLVTADAKAALADYESGAAGGSVLEFSGENENIMEAMGQLVKMLLLAVLLIYVIMAAQFQSLRSPFIVMFTIPLAFTGGLLGLLLTGQVVSVISMIGFVMLSGIIVNNGIVLVDYINQLRAAGTSKREAIVEAGKTRMRPILMTSLTTILALSVTAFSGGMGAEMMQPISIVCIGGLIYATLMTLFVVPVIYDLMGKKNYTVVRDEELEYTDEERLI